MTQTPNKMNKAEYRYILAVCECCRGILYGKGFLTERMNASLTESLNIKMKMKLR